MEWDTYLRALVALVFVLALISGLAWAVRRFGLGGPMARRPGNKRRLSVVEALPLDNRRRLILVRRDDVQHLILIGGGTDLILEKGITTSGNASGTGPEGGRES